MKHWFITTDGNLKARWKKAFPEMVTSKPDVFIGKAQPNDVVWLSTTVEGWSELIGSLTAKGAIVVVLSYSPNDEKR